MALFDTSRLIRQLRYGGYTVRTTFDDTGRKCWDVYYPNIHHNFEQDVNEVTEVYIGKVERYGGPEISGKALFGRPFFYLTHDAAVRASPECQNAIKIAATRGPGRRTTIREQHP